MVPKEEKQQVVQNIQDLIDKYANTRDNNNCSMLFLFANLKNVLWVGDERNEKHSDLEYFKRLRDLIDTDNAEAPKKEKQQVTPDLPEIDLSNAGENVCLTITIGVCKQGRP